MVIICTAGENNGMTEKGTAKRIASVLKKYNLPTEDENSLRDIISAMNSDKKRVLDGIKFVFIKSIGEGYIKKVKTEDIADLFGV